MKKGLLILASASVAAASQAIVIDDFTTGAYSQTISSGHWIGSQAATVPGLERDAGVVVTANPLNQVITTTVNGGMHVTASGPGLVAIVGLDYDGVGDEDGTLPMKVGPGLGGLNLNGDDRFRITWLENDLNLTLHVRVESTGGGVSTQNFTIAPGTNFQSDVMFSSITGPANFSSVERIFMSFATSAGGDFAIGQIATVPEPATLAVIGAGVVALLRRRRK